MFMNFPGRRTWIQVPQGSDSCGHYLLHRYVQFVKWRLPYGGGSALIIKNFKVCGIICTTV